MKLVDVKARCDEIGECWIWNGPLLRHKHPIAKVKGVTYYAKRVVWSAFHRKPIPDGMCVVNKKACSEQHCCNPEHLMLATKLQVLQRVVDSGKLHTTKIRAKIASTKRAKSKLSDEAVMEIRYSDEAVSSLSAKHGISEAYGHMIRRGDSRKDYANPFAGLIG